MNEGRLRSTPAPPRRRFPWGLAALVVISLALGCEARVSLGASCTYSSECGALRCLYGRCRAECLTNVDCSAGLVCNAGVCAEPSESCSADDPCLAPERACAGSICAERCSASGTCALGARCETRVGGLVCVPVESTPVDAGLDARATDDVGDLDAASDDAATPPDASAPADAFAPAGAIRDLCVSRYHVCVARGDGTVVCWGVGHAGELGGGHVLVSGDPGTIDCAPLGAVGSVCSLDPVVVVTDDVGTPLSDVDRLFCGERTTLALTGDGTLYSWGLGSSGQLGRTYPPIGSGDAIARPVTDRAAVPLENVLGATLGSHHGCAWLADGTTRCWGARYASAGGQLGTGAMDPTFAEGAVLASALEARSSAATVTDLGTCVVSDGLGVRCFGTNEAGAMGATDDVSTMVRAPSAIMGLPAGATALVSGPQFVCAHVGTDAHCWGQAGEGSLGRADVSTYPATRCPDGASYCDPRAEPVAGRLVFDAIAGGTASSTVCGLVAGQVRCWGSSEYGTAGLAPGGGISRYETPGRAVALEGGGVLSDVRSVRLGGVSACAVTRDDRLYCWGGNVAGHRRTTPDHDIHAEAVLVPLD